jgi:hypothetical protein
MTEKDDALFTFPGRCVDPAYGETELDAAATITGEFTLSD